MMNSGISRILEEFRDNAHNPISSIPAIVGLPDENNPFNWTVYFFCQNESPYKGGLFYLSLIFPQNYPIAPPEVKFITPIYHLNVKHTRDISGPIGKVDLSILNMWRPEYKVKDIIISVYSLFLMNKDFSSFSMAMSEEYKNNKNLYIEKCRYFTQKYASPIIGYKEYDNWDFSYGH